jgi:tetratricopeptide (TPR) repeat protein
MTNPKTAPSSLVRKALDDARSSLQRGDAAGAERHLIAALALAPRNAETLRLLGSAQSIQGKNAAALVNLRSALEIDDSNALTHNNLGNVLSKSGDQDAACAAYRRATELAPTLAATWQNLGLALHQNQWIDESLTVLTRAIELAPGHLRSRFLFAHGLRIIGRADESAAQYRKILAVNPHNAEAWLGLSQLSAAFDERDIACMRSAVKDPVLNDDDQISIRFALVRALEQRGEIEESFDWLMQANAQVRRWYPWNARAFSHRIDSILAAFTPAPEASSQSQGSEVIFIVSMPRAGSSLAEQILASHPDVDGAGELSELPAVLREEDDRRGKPFPQWVRDTTPDDWRRLGARYLERTARWRERHPRFTDKLPDNWRYIGAIAAMLPTARIVSCRRDPLETCLACYRQLFTGGGQAFSYDISDVAARFRSRRSVLARAVSRSNPIAELRIVDCRFGKRSARIARILRIVVRSGVLAFLRNASQRAHSQCNASARTTTHRYGTCGKVRVTTRFAARRVA